MTPTGRRFGRRQFFVQADLGDEVGLGAAAGAGECRGHQVGVEEGVDHGRCHVAGVVRGCGFPVEQVA
ncbi:MAG: hypothetical protein OSA99_19240 [Acidimicrobiales bacterium]|nr:hypothetical protein [Acidimicrobiales bacterium]